MLAGELRHLVVLAVGFFVSIVVSSTLFGPHVAYDGQPLFQQILTIFLLPTAASVFDPWKVCATSPRAGS